jgi:Uma2 family endonuclease
MSAITPSQVSQVAANINHSLLDRLRSYQEDTVLRKLRPKGLPLLYEDEGPEMGESSLHTKTADILHYGVTFHFTGRPLYHVFSNLNLHYSEAEPTAYVSPDVMVVQTSLPLPDELSSYRVGREGPAPVLVTEVLSFRTYQQGDLTAKPLIYAELGVEEYLLVDVTGDLLAQRVLLLRLQPGGTWTDEQDADGGITSRLGFRVGIDPDGQLRVTDARTGRRYARPDEAQTATDDLAAAIKARRKVERTARAEAKARAQAEDRIRALEAELARLRGTSPQGEKPTKKETKRRRKS